jgi:hypothetical protein
MEAIRRSHSFLTKNRAAALATRRAGGSPAPRFDRAHQHGAQAGRLSYAVSIFGWAFGKIFRL